MQVISFVLKLLYITCPFREAPGKEDFDLWHTTDATSGLDGSNCAIYVISCSNVAGGIPLGIVVTSSETTVTLSVALSKLQSVMPKWVFYNNGKQGPDSF